MHSARYSPVVALVMFSLLPFALAADPPAPAQPKTLPSAGADLPPTEELDVRLMPMRKADVGVEVEGWFALLRAKVEALGEVELKLKQAEGESKTQLLESAKLLRADRDAVIERLNSAVAAFKARGGDAAEIETYVPLVSGAKVDVTDVQATTTIAAEYAERLVQWAKSPAGGLKWAGNIVLFVVVLIASRIVAAVASSAVRRVTRKVRTMSDLLRDFFANITGQAISLIGLVVGLSMLGVNIGPMVAAIGGVAFVVGFALQGTLSNFAAGLMILLYRPYDVSDVVTAAGSKGRVESMTLVSTTLIDGDGNRIVIPNNAIWGGTITNHGAAAG